jgi:RimJ/RimL family protein N-acetyltransferase
MSQDMCVPCDGGIINIRVGAIILKGNRFLMVRNDKANYFYSVGGRIKFGETAEEAVVREVFEETGISMEIDHLGFVLENYFIGDTPARLGKETYELAFFFYMKTPEDFEPVCGSFTENNHKEYLEWVSPDDPRTVFPAFLRTELDIRNKNVRHIVSDDRFYLRKMKPSDLEALHALLSDSDAMEYLEKPFTLQQTKAFLETRGLAENPAVLAVENRSHEFIGYVIYHDYDGENNEIGWVLKKEVWGKGLASLLTKQMIAMAYAEGKGVVIECVPEQLATKRIAEVHGFRRTGTRDGLDVYQKK